MAEEDDLSFVSVLSRSFERFGPYEEIIPRWFQDQFIKTYIFEENGQRVGFFMLGLMWPVWFSRMLDLMAIAVVPEKRGRGIGTSMVEAAKRIARSKGYHFLRAHVGCDNQPALALFRRASFRLKKRIERYYPSGLAAYEFVADLRN